MKNIILCFVCLAISVFSFSQESESNKKVKLKFSTPLVFEQYQPFEVSNNDSIPALNSMFGIGFEWQVSFNSWRITLGTTAGFSYREKHGYESSVTSGSFELYGGRTFQLGKKFSVTPELGYNYVAYGYRLTNNNQTIDFDIPFSMNVREFQNSAHRIVPRLSFLLFKDLQIIASYHYDLSKNRWKVESGSLINSPREDFSAWRVGINYFF